MPRKQSKESSALRLGGGGAYTEEFAIIEEARDLFFEAIGRRCLDALRDLRDNVFPVYREWFRNLDQAAARSAVPLHLMLIAR